MNNSFLAILCIAISLIDGCAAKEDKIVGIPVKNTSSSIVQQCGDFARIPVRDYLLDNNVWGKSDASDYQLCVWADTVISPLKAGWSWSWQSSNGKVRAYPEIHYGWDWEKKFTTHKLPIKVNKIKEVQVTYDVTTSAEGLFNLAFDLWLTKASFPTRNNLSREVMIWVDGTKKNPGATLVGRFSIDDGEYDLFIEHDWNSWTYFAFVRVVPKLKGTLSIHKFLHFLKNAGYISPNEFLVEIEIGNEIWTGKGETVVNSYSIHVND